MPRFEIDVRGTRYEVEAPTLAEAVAATGKMQPKAGAKPPAEQKPPASQRGSWADSFVGQGLLMGAGDEMKAGVRSAARRVFGSSGKSLGELYNDELQSTRSDLEGFQERHPVLAPTLEIGGAIAGAPFIPGGVAARGASMGSRLARGAATGAGYGGAYGFASGEGTADRLTGAATGAATGGLVGAAAPLAVRGVQAAGRGIRDATRAASAPARGLINRDREAARRVGLAMQEDATINQPRLTRADERAARQAGQPVYNIDRGGETVRALARSAANTSPQGRALLENAVSDRFAGQGDRTIETVRRIVGGLGAPAAREQLQTQARTANRAAYRAAYEQGDRGLWSPTLERLTSSPAVVTAMRNAAQRGKDRAVTEGFGGFNPGVTVDPSGIVTFRRGLTGQPTYPNLQYWDYVKRELDDAANSARRAGRNEEAGTIGALAQQLRTELDNQVPSFAAARAGAARFFGAEDALSAGEQFVTSRMENDVARQAIARMNPAEQRLFAEGFGDALARRVAETGDRRNVINSLFLTSRASRERIEMALGQRQARELEAFLRVEGLLDRSRTAFGNSTTARQLTEIGLAGGVGGITGLTTGDWQTGGAVALGGLLVRHGMGRVDRAVATRVAEMLASPDPAIVRRGLRQVASNDHLIAALRRIDIPAALGGTQAAVRSDPLRIQLNAGERDQQMGAR